MQISNTPGMGATGPAGPDDLDAAAADAQVEAEAAREASERPPAPKGRAKEEEKKLLGQDPPEGARIQDGRLVRYTPKHERDAWRLVKPDDQRPAEELPVPTAVKGTVFVRAEGPLFRDGIAAGDVVQNAVGDCYFVASLSAVAHMRPEIIEDMLKENGDGTFTVTFRDPDTGDPLPAITVDGDLPFVADENGTLQSVAASMRPKGGTRIELWAPIIEKAYAVLRGGYRRIDQGGNGDEAFPAITGKHAPLVYVASYVKRGREDLIWKRLADVAENKWPATTSTPVSEVREERDEKSGILSGHVYTILDAYERDGKKYVKLRNPHGQNEPEGDGKDDGIFVIPFKKFLKHFEDISINKLEPGVGVRDGGR